MEYSKSSEIGSDDSDVNFLQEVIPVDTVSESTLAEIEHGCTVQTDQVSTNDEFFVDLLSKNSTGKVSSKQDVDILTGTSMIDISLSRSENISATDCTIINDKQNETLITSNALNSVEQTVTEVTDEGASTMCVQREEVENSAGENLTFETEAAQFNKNVEKVDTGCIIDTHDQSQTNGFPKSSAVCSDEKCEIEIMKDVTSEPQSTCMEKEQPTKSNHEENFSRNGYRCESDSWTDDEDSSTSDSSSSDSETFFQAMQDNYDKSKPKKLPPVKTKGELGLDDLPPIEDLVISVEEKEMTAIGKVHAIVETLVIIQALKGMKALDLDSVLFLFHDKPLGRIFDVFGPVNEPFYSIRFNTVDQINEKGVLVGADVYFAPEKSEITSYVFVEDLQNQKGSDASWKDNNEPPVEFLDYSDDDEERKSKRQRMIKNRNRQFSNDTDAPAKRPLLADDSLPSSYISSPKPAPQQNNSQNFSRRFSRPNPFQSRISLPSPSPSMCSLMSPIRVQNSFRASPNPSQAQVQQQNVLFRPSTPVFLSPFQQPHVFGQMTVLNPPPSPLPSPVISSLTRVFPTSPFASPFTSPAAQNHYHQGFPRSPSPAFHAQQLPPDPWFSNRSLNSPGVPPSHPLTVQIPSMNSPSLPVHHLQDRGYMQQSVNRQGANVNEPFVQIPRMNNSPFPVHQHPQDRSLVQQFANHQSANVNEPLVQIPRRNDALFQMQPYPQDRSSVQQFVNQPSTNGNQPFVQIPRMNNASFPLQRCPQDRSPVKQYVSHQSANFNGKTSFPFGNTQPRFYHR